MLRQVADFIFRGGFLARASLFDAAIGLVVIVAIQGLVNSLFVDIILPLIAKLVGSISFSDYFVPLSVNVTATTLEAAKQQGPVLAYGEFLTLLVYLLIVLAVVVPLVNSIRKTLARAHLKTPDDNA